MVCDIDLLLSMILMRRYFIVGLVGEWELTSFCALFTKAVWKFGAKLILALSNWSMGDAF